MIVVDASVAVKWVTGEQGRDAANALFHIKVCLRAAIESPARSCCARRCSPQ